MFLVENKRTKLTANWLNALAGARVGAGAPSAQSRKSHRDYDRMRCKGIRKYNCRKSGSALLATTEI